MGGRLVDLGGRLVQLAGLESAEAPRLRYGPAPILVAAVLFQLAVVLTAQLGSALDVPRGVWRPTVVVPLAVVGSTVLAAWLLAPGCRLRDAIGWPRRADQVVPLVLVSFLMVATISALAVVVAELFWQPPTPDTTAVIANRPASLDILASLHEHIAGPWAEELFFRLLVLRALLATRLSPAVAIVLNAVLFASSHFSLVGDVGPIDWAGFFGLGLAAALLTWRTGRLAPTLVAHVAFNVILTLGGGPAS